MISLQSHCVMCSGMGRCNVVWCGVLSDTGRGSWTEGRESMSTFDLLKCGREVPKEEEHPHPPYDIERADHPAKSLLLLSSVMNQAFNQLILAVLYCQHHSAVDYDHIHTRTHTQESLSNNLFIYMIRSSNFLGVSIVSEWQRDRQFMYHGVIITVK